MAIIRGTSGNDTLTGTPLNDLMYGFAGDDLLLGLAGNDTLYGGRGNDTLDGGLERDSLIGGFGDDTYIIDNVGDVVVENPNGGIDTVRSSVNYSLSSNVENLTISGALVLEGRGNDLDNVLIAGNASGAMESFRYTLRGGAGNDTLYGASGDFISSGTNYLYGGTGDDELVGGDLAENIMYGGAGNDTLYGAIYSQDKMYGGPGDDTYFLGFKGSFIVHEVPNNGIDTIVSGYSYILGDNFENLVLTTGYYSYAQVGTGNALNNKITGNAAANILQGLAGNDTLSGENGDDHLLGTNRGVGEIDVLIGGAGRDTFYLGNANTVFYDDSNRNTAGLKDYALIKDFNSQQDYLKLHGRRSDYLLAPSPAGLPTGTAIYLNKPGHENELISIIQGSSRLNINGKYFRFTSTEVNPSSLNGQNGLTLTGVSISQVSNAGDINGDGFDDLIIGSSQGSSSYVVFGTSNFNSNVNLTTLDETNGFKINGIPTRSGGFSNTSVSSAGDINGDGIADIIIGAPFASPNGRQNAGSSFVVFGKTGGFGANLNLANLNGSNGFRINGINTGDSLGTSISSAGDINGDGFDDLIISAPAVSSNNSYGRNAGAAYVVFGKASGFPTNLNLSNLNGSKGFTIQNNSGSSYRFSSSVSCAGDVNGDGYDDLVVGGEDNSSYVIFGSASGFTPTLDIASLNGRNGFAIVGLDAQSGINVSNTGDINGDGFDDLIIGAPVGTYNFYDIGTRTGKSYVVFGSASGFAPSIDVSTLNGTNGFTLNAINAYDNLGISVSNAGDVNGDGFDDLIVGASFANSNGVFRAGENYIVFGTGGFGANLNLAEIDGTNGFIVTGENRNAYLGSSVSSAGDLNGDGFDDVIVAASSSSESYVIFGRDFTNKVNRLGTPGDDLLIGTNGNDILIGGLGNDTLRGGRGSDVLYGGAGDDVLIFGPQNHHMDGGSGTDTLAIEVSSMTMALTAIPRNRISGIEIIDLTGTSNNSLKLDRLNVLNLSDTTNELIVKGNAGDRIASTLQGWMSNGTTTLDNNLYNRYTSGAAILLVDSDITQTIS